MHRRFLPLNARFQESITRWQVRPVPGEPMASNDHTDFRWDAQAVESLKSIGRPLTPLEADLITALARFAGCADRYDATRAAVARIHTRPVRSARATSGRLFASASCAASSTG